MECAGYLLRFLAFFAVFFFGLALAFFALGAGIMPRARSRSWNAFITAACAFKSALFFFFAMFLLHRLWLPM